MRRLTIAGKGPAFQRIIASTPQANVVHAGAPLVDADVLLSIGYDRILTPGELARYEYALNLHYGPLPEYRGCFPTKWAIINNEPAGVTLHHMIWRVDAGPVLEVWRTPSSSWMKDNQLYQALNQIAFELWLKWKPILLTGQIPDGIPQDESKARYYPRAIPYGGIIPDWATPDLKKRLVRAFYHPPYAA